MSKQTLLQSAYVLHTRAYRDTSLLVDLFTLDHGRVSAVARSARGPKSRFRGIFQLFMPLLVSWWGDGDLVNVTHAEQQRAQDCVGYRLTGNALLAGFYLNELLVRLLHRYDAHPNLFNYYNETLQQLMSADHLEIILRRFEKKLLTYVGYAPQWHIDVDSGEQVNSEHYYRYEANRGFVIAKQQEVGVVIGETLLAMSVDQLTHEHDLLAVKKIMRRLLLSQLGTKPLKSKELFF